MRCDEMVLLAPASLFAVILCLQTAARPHQAAARTLWELVANWCRRAPPAPDPRHDECLSAPHRLIAKLGLLFVSPSTATTTVTTTTNRFLDPGTPKNPSPCLGDHCSRLVGQQGTGSSRSTIDGQGCATALHHDNTNPGDASLTLHCFQRQICQHSLPVAPLRLPHRPCGVALFLSSSSIPRRPLPFPHAAEIEARRS